MFSVGPIQIEEERKLRRLETIKVNRQIILIIF